MREYCRSIVIFSAVAAMFVAGCAAVEEPVSAARQKCRDLGFSDDDIDTLLGDARESRDNAVTWEDTLAALLAGCEAGCGSATCQVNCPKCAAAVVDQVFE